MPSPALATVLGASIVLGPAAPSQSPPAAAPPQTAADPAAAPRDPTLEQAERLYREGQGKFETADYAAAIELWTRAYSELPNTAAYVRIRVLLLYNLATAQERAFEVDHDVRHLRQAQILLNNFQASLSSLYDRGDPEQAKAADHEGRRVQERLAQLSEQIARAEEEEEADAAAASEDPPPRPPRELPPARPLLVGGGVLVGVGGAALGLMTGGLLMGRAANDLGELDPADIEGRRSQFDRGRLGNTLAIVGGVVGGVALASGVVLVALGVVSRRRAAQAQERGHALRLWPSVTGRGAALGFSGRF